MKFMVISTYEPGRTLEVRKRRLELGTNLPPGLKVLGMWSDIAGGRGFTLCEGDDPNVLAQGGMAWSDLMSMECVPVIDSEEMLKLIK